jgi:hypothetical protein
LRNFSKHPKDVVLMKRNVLLVAAAAGLAAAAVGPRGMAPLLQTPPAPPEPKAVRQKQPRYGKPPAFGKKEIERGRRRLGEDEKCRRQ